MGFTVEHKTFDKTCASQQEFWSHMLCKMFPDRQWNAGGVKTLIKKTDMTNSIDRQRVQGHPRWLTLGAIERAYGTSYSYWPYHTLFPRHGDLLVENCKFSYPSLVYCPRSG